MWDRIVNGFLNGAMSMLLVIIFAVLFVIIAAWVVDFYDWVLGWFS